MGFPLASDPDHNVVEAFGIWDEKKMYGKNFIGVNRSAFLIGEKRKRRTGLIKISPKNTASELMKVLT